MYPKKFRENEGKETEKRKIVHEPYKTAETSTPPNVQEHREQKEKEQQQEQQLQPQQQQLSVHVHQRHSSTSHSRNSTMVKESSDVESNVSQPFVEVSDVIMTEPTPLHFSPPPSYQAVQEQQQIQCGAITNTNNNSNYQNQPYLSNVGIMNSGSRSSNPVNTIPVTNNPNINTFSSNNTNYNNANNNNNVFHSQTNSFESASRSNYNSFTISPTATMQSGVGFINPPLPLPPPLLSNEMSNTIPLPNTLHSTYPSSEASSPNMTMKDNETNNNYYNYNNNTITTTNVDNSSMYMSQAGYAEGTIHNAITNQMSGSYLSNQSFSNASTPLYRENSSMSTQGNAMMTSIPMASNENYSQTHQPTFLPPPPPPPPPPCPPVSSPHSLPPPPPPPLPLPLLPASTQSTSLPPPPPPPPPPPFPFPTNTNPSTSLTASSLTSSPHTTALMNSAAQVNPTTSMHFRANSYSGGFTTTNTNTNSNLSRETSTIEFGNNNNNNTLVNMTSNVHVSSNNNNSGNVNSANSNVVSMLPPPPPPPPPPLPPPPFSTSVVNKPITTSSSSSSTVINSSNEKINNNVMYSTSDVNAQVTSPSPISFSSAEVAQSSLKRSESDFIANSPNQNNNNNIDNSITSAAPPGYYESVPLSAMSSSNNNNNNLYSNTMPNVNCSMPGNANVNGNQSVNNDSICSSRLPHFTAVSVTRENSGYASCHNASLGNISNKPQPTCSTSFVAANPLEPNENNQSLIRSESATATFVSNEVSTDFTQASAEKQVVMGDNKTTNMGPTSTSLLHDGTVNTNSSTRLCEIDKATCNETNKYNVMPKSNPSSSGNRNSNSGNVIVSNYQESDERYNYLHEEFCKLDKSRNKLVEKLERLEVMNEQLRDDLSVNYTKHTQLCAENQAVKTDYRDDVIYLLLLVRRLMERLSPHDNIMSNCSVDNINGGNSCEENNTTNTDNTSTKQNGNVTHDMAKVQHLVSEINQEVKTLPIAQTSEELRELCECLQLKLFNQHHCVHVVSDENTKPINERYDLAIRTELEEIARNVQTNLRDFLQCHNYDLSLLPDNDSKNGYSNNSSTYNGNHGVTSQVNGSAKTLKQRSPYLQLHLEVPYMHNVQTQELIAQSGNKLSDETTLKQISTIGNIYNNSNNNNKSSYVNFTKNEQINRINTETSRNGTKTSYV